jgi:hypothetical protein
MSRTINPLHFEDLEPKRFEDLVRQLAYDYRTWSDIEATGRSGSDDGFDIRAWEKIAQTDEDTDEPADRKWLIQCKREQSIGPSKAQSYAKDITKENKDLYGVLFVTSSELSKKARDAIREEFASAGLQEIHIWTRSELEDQLFQPKNDHLLFAYFGFSLLRKKSSTKTKVKSRLAIKRKLHRVLGDSPYGEIMIRDAGFERYPTIDKYEGKQSDDPPVVVGRVQGYYFDGLVIAIARYHAYYDRDNKEFDYDGRYNQINLSPSKFSGKWEDNVPKNHQAFSDFHRSIDETKRYHYVQFALIPYDSIVDIDEKGDEYFDSPHLFVLRDSTGLLYRRSEYEFIHPNNNFNQIQHLNKTFKRIQFFPKTYRTKKPKQETENNSQPPKGDIEKPFPQLSDKDS